MDYPGHAERRPAFGTGTAGLQGIRAPGPGLSSPLPPPVDRRRYRSLERIASPGLVEAESPTHSGSRGMVLARSREVRAPTAQVGNEGGSCRFGVYKAFSAWTRATTLASPRISRPFRSWVGAPGCCGGPGRRFG